MSLSSKLPVNVLAAMVIIGQALSKAGENEKVAYCNVADFFKALSADEAEIATKRVRGDVPDKVAEAMKDIGLTIMLTSDTKMKADFVTISRHIRGAEEKTK